MHQNLSPQPLLSPRQALAQCLAQLRALAPSQVPGEPPGQPGDNDPQRCRQRFQALCLFERHHVAWYAQAQVPPESHLPFEVLLLVALAKANLQQKAARPTPTPPPAPPPTVPPSETVSAQRPSSLSEPGAPASAASPATSAEEPSPLDLPVLPSSGSPMNRPGGPEPLPKGDATQDEKELFFSPYVSPEPAPRPSPGLAPSGLTRPTVPPSFAEVTPLRSPARGEVPRGRRGLAIEPYKVGTPRPSPYVIDSCLMLTAAWARCEEGPGRGRCSVRPLPGPAAAYLSAMASSRLLSTDVRSQSLTSPRRRDQTRPAVRIDAGAPSSATWR